MNATDRDTRQHAAAENKAEGFLIARGIVPKTRDASVFAEMHGPAVQQLRQHVLPGGRRESIEAMPRDLQTLFDLNLKAYLAILTLRAPVG